MYILDANMYVSSANMYILGANMYILSVNMYILGEICPFHELISPIYVLICTFKC